MDAEEALELIFLPDGNLSEVEDSQLDSDELDFATVNNKGTSLESEVLENDDMAVEADAATEEAQPTTSTAKKNPKKYEWKEVPTRNEDNTFDLVFSDPPDKVLFPLTYFKMFVVDDECIGYIAEQTNMYAMQKDGKETAVTIHEMEQFFSIILSVSFLSDVLGRRLSV